MRLEPETEQDEGTVNSSGTVKKRYKGWRLAAGWHAEPKELTGGICGSWRKLAAPCRKVSRHAAVAWHKRNSFSKIQNWGNCGSLK
jgi:hypothetical protein